MRAKSLQRDITGTPPEFNIAPKKSILPKGKVAFQAPSFRGYVNFWGSRWIMATHAGFRDRWLSFPKWDDIVDDGKIFDDIWKNVKVLRIA